jgi:hypothetical protein
LYFFCILLDIKTPFTTVNTLDDGMI